MDKRTTVNAAELLRLQQQENRPTPLTTDEVNDYAVAALMVLRGLTRGEKLRVVRRITKILG